MIYIFYIFLYHFYMLSKQTEYFLILIISISIPVAIGKTHYFGVFCSGANFRPIDTPLINNEPTHHWSIITRLDGVESSIQATIESSLEVVAYHLIIFLCLLYLFRIPTQECTSKHIIGMQMVLLNIPI